MRRDELYGDDDKMQKNARNPGGEAQTQIKSDKLLLLLLLALLLLLIVVELWRWWW